MSHATAGFAQVNPIATLIPPATGTQQPAQADVANAAHVLVAQFAQPESTQSRTRAIWEMALSLTVTEFQVAMDKALDTAKANDKAAGFKPANGATGRAKYGPMQSSLATVASQCRQVFGACKIDPECIVSTADGQVVNFDLFPNWSTAVDKARAFLTDKKCDWTGNPLSAVEAAKKAKAKRADDADVMAEVMAAHPQQPGESMADYMVRIADDVQEAQGIAYTKQVTESAKKELTRLIKVHGDNLGDVLEQIVIQYNALLETEETE